MDLNICDVRSIGFDGKIFTDKQDKKFLVLELNCCNKEAVNLQDESFCFYFNDLEIAKTQLEDLINMLNYQIQKLEKEIESDSLKPKVIIHTAKEENKPEKTQTN